MTIAAFDAWRSTPIASRPALSVVIPAYNERRRIVPTIASIAAHLAEREAHWELIVADDGSSDGMVERLHALRMVNLRVVGTAQNEGKGAAVRRGLLAARGEAVLFTDADMSTPIDEVDRMLDVLGSGADVVVASRAASGADVSGKSAVRRVCSSGLRGLAAVTLPTGVTDTQCGFKLFRGAVARTLAERLTIEGFSFDLELLYLARRAGLRVVEHPVTWVDAPGSTVSPGRVALRFLRDIPTIRWRARRTRPAVPAVPGAAAQPSGDRPVRLAVVTPLPPSTTTLNEYGHHLVHALAAKPEVGELVVLHDQLPGPVAPGAMVVPPKATPLACWRFGSLANAVSIARAVRRTRPDAVLFNIQFATFGADRVSAGLGLVAPALVRATGTPSVVLLHNLVDTVDLEAAGYAGSPLVARLYRRAGEAMTRVLLLADRVSVTLPAYADILESRYRAANVYLAPHGTFDPVTGDIGVPAGPTRILAFGKFGTYKRVEDLVEAYRLLLEAGYEDLELVVAGTDAAPTPGYLAEVAAANTDLPGLRFTGYVPEQEVEAVFRSAAVVAFPYTATTGSSGPLHQAGSFGRAVVLPEIGDLLEVVREEGFAAEAFQPGDAMSLAGAIARLLDDPARREANARQNAVAAGALPITEIADWHLLHLGRVTNRGRRALVRLRRAA